MAGSTMDWPSIGSSTFSFLRQYLKILLNGGCSSWMDIIPMKLQFWWAAYSAPVFLLYLPLHCSHILQPLDLALFGPLKQAYRTEYRKLACPKDPKAIEHQKYVFETLWSKTVSAEQRIREIEEGNEPEFFDVIIDNVKAS